MQIIRKTVRFAATALAGLFIVLGLAGIFGVWWAERAAADFALNAFRLVEGAVGVVDAGVTRVDNLVTTSRTEVRQAAETLTTVGERADANRPVLGALGDRLETSLAPRIGQMQQALGPVRDAVGIVSNAVSLVNSLPTMAERAPRLAALDESFNRLEELAADTTQLRSTLRALVAAQAGNLTPETVATINGLARRIDTRLAEVQANVDGVQAEIDALQARIDARKTRMLFVFNLVAVLVTLMLVWILYSQFVVIRHHRIRAQRHAAGRAEADGTEQ